MLNADINILRQRASQFTKEYADASYKIGEA
jgi:hypothetical protein